MLLIIVHRLLQSILLPPLNAILFMAFGYMLHRHYKSLGRGVIIFGLGFLYLQATPLLSYQFSRLIEPEAVTQKELAQAQAIVVVGAGLKPHAMEYPTHVTVSNDTLVRLSYTAYLARQFPGQLVVTSGGYTGVKYREADVMRDTLINFFGVENPIIIEGKSRNTDENAKFVTQLLHADGIQHVVLVTSASHMRRAAMLFRKYGLNVVTAPTDFATDDDANTKILALVPTAHALAITSRTLHELIGYVFDSL